MDPLIWVPLLVVVVLIALVAGGAALRNRGRRG